MRVWVVTDEGPIDTWESDACVGVFATPDVAKRYVEQYIAGGLEWGPHGENPEYLVAWKPNTDDGSHYLLRPEAVIESVVDE